MKSQVNVSDDQIEVVIKMKVSEMTQPLSEILRKVLIEKSGVKAPD